MGSREVPALMMDPTNCSPVQVAGTCQKSLPVTARPDGSCMSLHKDQTGEIIHLQPGWVADLAACLPSSIQPRCEDLDLKLPGVQQPLPEVHTPRAWHRCSTPAWRGDEWHIDTYHMVLRLLACVSSWSSGQVRRWPHLMEADSFPGACHSRIISSDRKSVWFG